MIHSILLFALLCVAPLSAEARPKQVETSLEENLALRRISEYWKERDYKAAKLQIEMFLSKMPESAYADRLWAMLGDLYFQEKNYKQAIVAYDKIEGKEGRLNTLFHRLHSLYETASYEAFVLAADLFLNYPNATSGQIDTIYFELAESQLALAYLCQNAEKKEKLLWDAIADYQKVMHSSYGDLALLPQAQAYTLLEEYPKAAPLFLLLSQKEPEKKGDYLFQAASLQCHYNRSAAIKTFAEIVEMGGAHAPQAAFNQLTLLFQEKRYEDFIVAYDKVFKHVLADQTAVIRYFLGQSLVCTQDFAKAVLPLSESLNSKRLDRLQEKGALLALILCAKEEKDLALFEKTLLPLKKEFAEDEETFNSMLMHVELCRKKQEWSKARSATKELLTLFPSRPEKASLMYDEAILLAQEKRWEESAEAFESFLSEFPRNPQMASALRHLVLARQEDLKCASVESTKVKQQRLLEALEIALEEPKTFASVERQALRYQLGQIQYQLCQYEEAIDTLSSYLVDFGKDPSCAEAYLLLAYSHLQGSQDEMQFALNAERALAYNPTIEGAADVRLCLFNTYLKLAERAPSDEKKEMISKAADHLFFALEKCVSQENQQWLSAYYFRQYEKGQVGAAHRAAFVLEKLLGVSDGIPTLSIDAHTLAKEGEAIKLASLYEKIGRLPKKVELLETLISLQNKDQELNWKYHRMAQFELGKTYLALRDEQKALSTFDHLIQSSSHLSSYFAIAAQLEKAKLQFSTLKSDEELSEIYNTLKDIQFKRKLHSEPLHLEAALTYVDFKVDRSDPAQRLERAEFYLSQMQENFTSLEDPLVEEYLSAAAQFPEKEALFQQYLAFVDAELAHLRGARMQSAALKNEAKQKFEQLLADATDPTLTERIHKSMEALSQSQ